MIMKKTQTLLKLWVEDKQTTKFRDQKERKNKTQSECMDQDEEEEKVMTIKDN